MYIYIYNIIPNVTHIKHLIVLKRTVQENKRKSFKQNSNHISHMTSI